MKLKELKKLLNDITDESLFDVEITFTIGYTPFPINDVDINSTNNTITLTMGKK